MKPIFLFPPALASNDYDKVQSEDFQYVYYLNCYLLYFLTVLKYFDNADLISSKTSLKYKQYIPIIIAKQHMVIQSRRVKLHLGI